MKTAEVKAEELYTHYDNLLSKELQLNILVKQGEITEFVKDCCRKACNESIEMLEDLKIAYKNQKIFIPDGLIDSKIHFWFAVRKEIENIKDYQE